jgi:transposase
MPKAKETPGEGGYPGTMDLAEPALATPKKNAAKGGAAIYFEDEVGFTQQGTTIRTWAPRGEGVVVESAPGRSSIKAFGAIEFSSSPKFAFSFAKTLNGDTFVSFLGKLLLLERHRPIYLVVDGVSYHRSEEVREFLMQLPRGRLTLVRLPAYSPEYNPTEFVWRETKRRSTHNRYFHCTWDLQATVTRQFQRFVESPDLIRGALALYA